MGYWPYLDGLRGLAIVLVLWFHAGGSAFRGGYVGVDVFFVLSGYLITSLLIKEWDRDGRIGLKNFYLRRALRLLPAVVAMLIVVVSVWAVILDDLRPKLRDALLVLFYGANWARAMGLQLGELNHTWSLSIEEQFYLLWPPIFMAIAWLRCPRGWAAAGVGLLAIVSAGLRAGLYLAGRADARVYNGLDTRCDALLIGCAVAFWLATPASQKDALRKPLRLLANAAAFFLLVVAVRTKWDAPWMFTYGYFLVAIAAAVVLLDLQTGRVGVVRHITEWPPLVKLGRISYGVYLWHYPVYHVIDHYRGVLGIESRWPVRLFVGGAITLAIATLSYRCIESQFLRLKTRFQ